MLKQELPKILTHLLHLEGIVFTLQNTLTFITPCEVGLIPLLFTDEQTAAEGH